MVFPCGENHQNLTRLNMEQQRKRSSPLILVADDERLSRILLRRILTQEGYELVETKDGEECLRAYVQYEPDMVLLDAMMPLRDGFSCCEELRKQPNSDRVPILMITGLDDRESVNRAFEAGATDYITKPIHAPVLTRRLRRLLEASRAERELQRQYDVLQGELKEAANYVRSLLPSPREALPIAIQQQFIPSLQLGGDVFDYYWLDEDHFVFYLLDVSGHGVRSALLSVSVLNLLRSRSLANANFLEPQTVLKELNRVFSKETGEDYFTIWYGVYHRQSQKLIYASAGHPPAVLFYHSGREKLATEGLPIGMFPETNYQEAVTSISENNIFYLFSDGVYEISQGEEVWGIDNLLNLLSQPMSKVPPDLEFFCEQILDLSETKMLPDDFSILQIAF